jgi:protease I
MKSLIITWESFQDQELVYPFHRLKEETEDVVVAANVVGRFHGIMGVNMTSNLLLSELVSDKERFLSDFDLLVLPGGVKALEKLRQEKAVISFIKEWTTSNKVVASTCHGAQLLISADVVRGRRISAYYSIEDDIKNAGAEYINAPVVVDRNIVSSPHYDYMGVWMKTAIDQVKNATIG